MNITRLLICICTILSLSACNNINSEHKTQSDVFSEVIDSGTIRAGYIAYPPSLIVDPNTNEISGISADILQLAAKNLGLKLEFVEEVGWSSMIESVESNRVDVIATSIWPTAARSKRADFVTPNFYSYVKAYVRNDDHRFDNNIQAANSAEIKIAIIDGEMAANIAASDFPNADTVSLTQVSDVTQLLLEVATHKADITFVEPAIALSYMSKNPNSIKEVNTAKPIRLFPNSFLIKKGEINFKNTLDVTITELINSGAVDQILSKYEKYPKSFGRVVTPTQ